MIYSRFRPALGGYDYFDDGVPHNINDDLPTPDLPEAGNPIGVPSVEAGRPIPAHAVWVGDGSVAVGVLAPLEEGQIQRRNRSLSGDGVMAWLGDGALSPWVIVGMVGLGVGIGYYGASRVLRRRR